MIEVIQRWSGIPFRYGADCCQFVGECVEAVTGNNPMRAFDYTNKAEADAIIARFGDLEAAITATLGVPGVGRKDGDVATITGGDGAIVAGVIYHDRIIARTASGIMDYPLARARLVWST